MAHVIRLIYGTLASYSYVELTDANHGNVDYYPQTPAAGADEISESGTFRVAGSSVTDLISKVREIETIFHKANTYSQDGIGAYGVWIQVATALTVESSWHSQILEGRLELTENVFGVDWANYETEVVLYWRRVAYWEQYATVAASNSNGSAPEGVKVYNRGDGSGSAPTKAENWLDIAAAAVPGDLPAPAVFVLATNTSLNDFMMLHNARSNPTGTWKAEGETGSGDTTDANRSGGKCKTYTTPAGGTTGVDVAVVPTSLDDLVNGAWLRFILSANFTGTVYARPYVSIESKRYYGSKAILTGTGEFTIFDLGMLRLPAINFGGASGFSTGFGLFTVGINFIAVSAIPIAVDYFYYTPIDSFARAITDAWVISNVLIDSRAQAVLANDGGAETDKTSTMGTLYGGIWLEPNMDQRIHFKMVLAGADTLSNSATIQIGAWIRRRTI